MCYFIFTEVSFGTYEYDCICTGLHHIFQQWFFAWIAMGYKLLPGKRLADESVEISHLVQFWKVCFK